VARSRGHHVNVAGSYKVSDRPVQTRAVLIVGINVFTDIRIASPSGRLRLLLHAAAPSLIRASATCCRCDLSQRARRVAQFDWPAECAREARHADRTRS